MKTSRLWKNYRENRGETAPVQSCNYEINSWKKILEGRRLQRCPDKMSHENYVKVNLEAKTVSFELENNRIFSWKRPWKVSRRNGLSEWRETLHHFLNFSVKTCLEAVKTNFPWKTRQKQLRLSTKMLKFFRENKFWRCQNEAETTPFEHELIRENNRGMSRRISHENRCRTSRLSAENLPIDSKLLESDCQKQLCLSVKMIKTSWKRWRKVFRDSKTNFPVEVDFKMIWWRH